MDSLILPGTIISKGSEINLILGQGLSNKTTLVPNLVGFTLFMAKKYLADRYLNIGAAIYDISIEDEEDSTTCFIWKQSPEFDESNRLQLGAAVDIFLTVDSTKMPLSDTIVLEETEFIEDFFND